MGAVAASSRLRCSSLLWQLYAAVLLLACIMPGRTLAAEATEASCPR
jgi:hypothetical protein